MPRNGASVYTMQRPIVMLLRGYKRFVSPLLPVRLPVLPYLLRIHDGCCREIWRGPRAYGWESSGSADVIRSMRAATTRCADRERLRRLQEWLPEI